MPARIKLISNPTTDLARSARPSLDCPANKFAFEAQIPRYFNWRGYSALAQATRARVALAEAIKHLEILVLLCLREGHAHKAQLASHSSDGRAERARSGKSEIRFTLSCGYV